MKASLRRRFKIKNTTICEEEEEAYRKRGLVQDQMRMKSMSKEKEQDPGREERKAEKRKR